MSYSVCYIQSQYRVMQLTKMTGGSCPGESYWREVIACGSSDKLAFRIMHALEHADTCVTHELEMMASA